MIDENLSEAHAANGFLQLWKLDFTSAEKSLKQAVELNQNSWLAHGLYGIYLIAIGDFQSALEHHYKSIELSPHIIQQSTLSTKLMMMGRFQQAIDNAEEYLDVIPNRGNIYYCLALSYSQLKNFDKALKNIKMALDITPSTENKALSGYIYALSGNHYEAFKILNDLIDNYDNAPVELYDIAIIYAALGNKDKAFEYLEKAYQSKFSVLFFLKIDPRFKSLRSDSRFTSLLQRMGLA